MAFNQQDRKSSIVSLGWQASGKIANVRPYAQVTWEYEMEDDLRYVQASVYGMGGGFSIPVYQPDSNWFNFNLGAAADFGKVTGYISGSATAGKSDGDSYAHHGGRAHPDVVGASSRDGAGPPARRPCRFRRRAARQRFRTSRRLVRASAALPRLPRRARNAGRRAAAAASAAARRRAAIGHGST